jgi:sarcosine oxidase
MAEAFDVIVVGVGAMGASACFHLANRGVRVLGLEQFDIPNFRGSSHGYSRMIRLAYYEKPDYVPLLRRSYELWKEIEQNSGQRLLFQVGGVFVGPADGLLLKGARASVSAHRLDAEIFNRDKLRRRWPQFHVPDEWEALFDPAAGFLRPELAIAAFATLALNAGADLHAHEPVLEWRAEKDHVTVRTARDTYQAAQLVFAGGPWSGKLLNDLGVELKVTRQVAGWVWPRRPELFEQGRFPVWGIDALERGGIYYGFPMTSDVPGLKLAHHYPPESAIDPDAVDRSPRPVDEEDFRVALRQYLPDADGSLLALRTCLYTNTPDEDFIVDAHPQHPHVSIACGFSGHGFKFASVIGEMLADRVAGNDSPYPVEFLKLRRF